MSNELRDLRLSSGLPAPTIAGAIKEIYPRFDKALLSKCEHPDDYGVRLFPKGMEAARALVPGWQPKKKENRKYQCRISCRMDEETYARLISQIRQDGFRTIQDWLLDHVLAYINATNY